MTERIDRLYAKLKNTKPFPICVEKATIVTEAYKKYDAYPLIVKRAYAVAEYMDKRTIFIADDELLVGNLAAKPLGLELKPISAGWPDDDLDSIINGGLISISDEDRKVLRSLDEYWLDKGRTFEEHQGMYYDDERLFPFRRHGFITPAWKDKRGGRGPGIAGDGWGLKYPTGPFCPDYNMHLATGFADYISKAEEELKNLRYHTADDKQKADFLRATIIEFSAMIRIAHRFAALADEMADKCSDPVRAGELRVIAETCRQVPKKPARTFREALQAYIFYWHYVAGGATGMGRMDMYLYPFYKADLEAGRITRDEALELLCCMRLKLMEFNYLTGGKFQREKWAGMARWNNIIIGGCDRDGNDATNDLSYLLLESAFHVRTPHPTMTVRVSENTPQALMDLAVKLVSTGLGMPAFVSEKSYIDYIVSTGVPVEDAREFAIAGCLDIALPGKSRMPYVSMFIVPMILEIAMNNGADPKTGEQLGPQTGYLRDFKTWDEFYDALIRQCEWCVDTYVEISTIKVLTDRDLYPEALLSGFVHGSLKAGKDMLARPMEFENGVAFNVVGMANMVNSLAALKKLVYDEKKVSPEQMHDALLQNWAGAEDIRQMCLDVPKFGNNAPETDSVGAKFWEDLGKIVRSRNTLYGKPLIASAISITAHAPGGAATGATPDGRFAGETLADGSVSPVQGTDKSGPLAVMQSAMQMSKGWSVNLLNMKFTPQTVKTDADKQKLSSMIRTYLTNGGKHVQFNIVDKATLEAAMENKEQYSDLVVRVAGYSAYFVNLTKPVQREIILRTEHTL